MDPINLLHDENVYVSIDDVPHDSAPKEEGDNSVLGEMHDISFIVNAIASPAPLPPAPDPKPQNKNRIVPLPRTIKLNDRGYDVLAVKRALSYAGYRKWDIKTNKYGVTLANQVKKFQKAHGLTQDGQYGLETHKKLKAYYGLFEANLMLQQQAALDPRLKIISNAIFGYNNRYAIHYTQSAARMYGVRNGIHQPDIPIWEDCSSFATWCYYAAGLSDPNGLGYNGQGYTGTLAQHGKTTKTIKPGDLNFYGYPPHHHVTIAVSSSTCVSHGAESGPLLLPIKYRGDYYYTRTYL